jgi:hypothetical protein
LTDSCATHLPVNQDERPIPVPFLSMKNHYLFFVIRLLCEYFVQNIFSQNGPFFVAAVTSTGTAATAKPT